MPQYARPSSDLLAGNWRKYLAGVAGDASSLFSYVDEAVADENDTIRSGSTPIADRVGLALSSVGTPDAGGSITIRARIRAVLSALPLVSVPFYWDAVPLADNYVLQLSRDGGVSWPLSYTAGYVTTLTVSLESGSYKSRVLAYASGIFISQQGPEDVNV